MIPSSTFSSRYLLRVTAGLVLCGMLYLVFIHLVFSADEHDLKFADFERRKEVIDAIVLGHSMGGGIDFDVLGLEGMHFHEGGGDWAEALFKARILVPELPALRYVFLTASNGILLQETTAPDEAHRNIVRNLPISWRTLVARPRHSAERFLARYVLRPRILSEWIGLHPEETPIFHEGTLDRTAPPEEMEREIGEVALRLQHELEARPARRAEVIARNLIHLETLADFLEQRDITLVLVRFPLSPRYRSAMSLLSPRDELLDAFVARRPSVSLIDGSAQFDSSLAHGNNVFFYDPAHLNVAGIKAFSEYLRDSLPAPATSADE